MAAQLEIKDGSPVWISDSIIPSADMVVSPGSSPSLAAINVNSKNIFVYVNVKNSGTIDLGTCSCMTGPWPGVINFANILKSTALTATQAVAGVTFKATPAGDSLSGPAFNYNFGLPASGKRSWAWSADGNFFAYASSSTGTDWSLIIIAVKTIVQSGGATLTPGKEASKTSSNFGGAAAGGWDNTNFGWLASNAVMASGPSPVAGSIARVLSCPYANGVTTNHFGETVADHPAMIGWSYLISPCGSVVALAPKILAAGAGPANFYFVSTKTALIIGARQNNIPITLQANGSAPSLNTLTHTVNGVSVNLGSGAPIKIDDPDCSFVGGGIAVTVDRVKASTLPGGNLGVLSIGSATIGQLPVGASAWVQVPNVNPAGRANQAENHWCLLGQAYTTDGLAVPRPWNGQLTSPPAFPRYTDQLCSKKYPD